MLATAREVSFARLASENFLVREAGSGTRAAMEEVFASHSQSITSSMEMSSNETIKQAVIAGLGLAFISAHTIGLELATGRLVTLAVQGLPLERQWYVIHLAAKRLSPIAASFRDYLLENGKAVIDETINRRA